MSWRTSRFICPVANIDLRAGDGVGAATVENPGLGWTAMTSQRLQSPIQRVVPAMVGKNICRQSLPHHGFVEQLILNCASEVLIHHRVPRTRARYWENRARD